MAIRTESVMIEVPRTAADAMAFSGIERDLNNVITQLEKLADMDGGTEETLNAMDHLKRQMRSIVHLADACTQWYSKEYGTTTRI
jgi:hypothetical protein